MTCPEKVNEAGEEPGAAVGTGARKPGEKEAEG